MPLGLKKISNDLQFPFIFFALVARTDMKFDIQIYHPLMHVQGGHKCFTNISCLHVLSKNLLLSFIDKMAGEHIVLPHSIIQFPFIISAMGAHNSNLICGYIMGLCRSSLNLVMVH
jgi:hypothetical protein